LSYQVRQMRPEDIPQVSEIDREAFHSGWTQTDFKSELKNPLAHYIVVADEKAPLPATETIPRSGPRNLLAKIKEILGYRPKTPPEARQYIYGFAGFWVMADEAHITNIAVREQHRRQGLGELLLLSIFELAGKLDAGLLTLEVRASNIPAQKLYLKYGFSEVGLRKGYYTDDKEDALIMSTEDISSASFKARFEKLKQNYLKRYNHTGT